MRKNRKIKKKSKINYYVFFVSTIIFIGILIFNDFGLINFFKLQKKQNLLSIELQQLFTQQEELRLEINQLQTDQQYIEKIAREKFMMVLPGERVYRVQEEKQLQQE